MLVSDLVPCCSRCTFCTLNVPSKGFGALAGLYGDIVADSTADACAGIGAMACIGIGITEGEITLGGSVNYGRSYLLDSENDEYSHLVSFTWSYLTSGEQTEPGQNQDVSDQSFIFRERKYY